MKNIWNQIQLTIQKCDLFFVDIISHFFLYYCIDNYNLSKSDYIYLIVEINVSFVKIIFNLPIFPFVKISFYPIIYNLGYYLLLFVLP